MCTNTSCVPHHPEVGEIVWQCRVRIQRQSDIRKTSTSNLTDIFCKPGCVIRHLSELVKGGTNSLTNLLAVLAISKLNRIQLTHPLTHGVNRVDHLLSHLVRLTCRSCSLRCSHRGAKRLIYRPLCQHLHRHDSLQRFPCSPQASTKKL